MILNIQSRLPVSGVLPLAPISDVIKKLQNKVAMLTRCPWAISSYRAYHLIFLKEDKDMAPYVVTESKELAQATFPVFSENKEDPELKTKMEFSLPIWAKEDIQTHFLTVDTVKLLVVERCKILGNEDILYTAYAVSVEPINDSLPECKPRMLKLLCKKKNRIYSNSIPFFEPVF